jgi:uncharacterized protein YbcI
MAADEEEERRPPATGEDARYRDAEEELARELLQILESSYGKGARQARVHVLGDMVFCVLDGIELLPNEQFLVDNGKASSVIEVRLQYQQAIETTFRAAVERATGRRVVSFASVTKIDPNYAVEVFRLAEDTGTELPEP